MRSTADIHAAVTGETSYERGMIRLCGELSAMLNEALTQPDPLGKVQAIAERLDAEKAQFAESLKANVKRE